MNALTERQKGALEHEHRSAIYDFLKGTQSATLGEIAEATGIKDVAIAHYHLNRLIDVGLVEKVWGTNHYRAVER